MVVGVTYTHNLRALNATRHIDQLARDCTCAGIDPASAVLEFGDDGETYNASCVQTPDPEATCGEDDGIICEQIGLVCQFAGSALWCL